MTLEQLNNKIKELQFKAFPLKIRINTNFTGNYLDLYNERKEIKKELYNLYNKKRIVQLNDNRKQKLKNICSSQETE